LDEAHERSVNSDVLMALVKAIVKRRSGLKLVVMSATLDLVRLSKYFESDCLVKLEGRTHPIEIFNTL
jgi:pre-mRNA-splicing factor ATP-dependent RNA helicase DHX15/PRP43